MAKKTQKTHDENSSMARHEDGHWLLHGARWHSPKLGSPTECAVPGCERVLGQWRHPDVLLDGLSDDDGDDIDPGEETDETDETVEAVQDMQDAAAV